MINPKAAEIALDSIIFLFCGYQLGRVRGWDQGFKDGNAMGYRFGMVQGRLEEITRKAGSPHEGGREPRP
jgi:hypothetical protein